MSDDSGGGLEFAAAPNCPTCLRPMEVVEAYGGVLMWDCGFGCDLDH